jgi:predicted amidophosphoribosyltransferase
MGKFIHHSNFPKDKHIQSYLFPNVCFKCKKSFKKPRSDESRHCPECGCPLTELSRKFKTPKKDDAAAWEVVEFVVSTGFRYQSIHIDNGQLAKYPSNMNEAIEFVSKYKGHLK